MIRFVLIFLLILTSGYAKIELEEINSKPSSRAKDFMIWQYLKQNITPNQADEAYAQVRNKKNRKILYRYVKKTKNKHIKYKISCKNRSNLLKIKKTECLELAFSPYKAAKLTNKKREKLIKKLKSQSKINILKILNEKHEQNAYRKYDAGTILTLFDSTGYKYRKKYLNIYLDKELVDSIASSWRVSRFIKRVVNDDKFDKLQLSLLNMDGQKLNSKSNFFLALNHLRHLDKYSAIKYFKLSRLKAKFRINVDKNNFWLYKTTQDKSYLKILLKSTDINIYTLYAREKMNVNFNNYFSKLDTNKKISKKKFIESI